MEGIDITIVTRSDVPLLDDALRKLAIVMGDDYLSGQADLETAVCGPEASCLALLARAEGRPVGCALAAPVFSTMRGGAGLFVSDLWVAEGFRGNGLARRLLAATLREGVRRNSGRFLKLTVYQDNPGASAAYDRVGFTEAKGETNLFLTGRSLKTLKETA